jgi:glycosyltransferase involved in cell wall biosynthesis
VLSPSEAADQSLAELGVPLERIGRWDRGVDCERFSPAKREEGPVPGRLDVLYAGRLTKEKGVDLLADAFLAAHARDPRLHLVLAGGGPEEPRLRERLGEHATFFGWLEGDDLAAAYASADIFLFPSRTDTFGQVILEAMASGAPVVAVDEGGPRSIIRHGRTGLLRSPDAEDLAHAVNVLADDSAWRERLAAGALEYVRHRTWEASLRRLADGYRQVLESAAPREARRAA